MTIDVTKIVVNPNTRKAIPPIYYVGLSTVTTIKGLYIPDLCKIAINSHVVAEMEFLRNEGVLKLSVTSIYMTDQVLFKLVNLNAQYFLKHVDDICCDYSFTNTDINMFSELNV